MEPSNPEGAPLVDVHAPFTRAERMQQLAEIDQVSPSYSSQLACRSRI